MSSPCNGHCLTALGDAQLAAFDLIPDASAPSALRLVQSAQQSYRASISVEGKSASGKGEVPARCCKISGLPEVDTKKLVRNADLKL